MILIAVQLSLVLGLHQAVTPHHHNDGGSAPVRQFVQRFYDWYVPKATHPGGPDAVLLALRKKRDSFSPALRKDLVEDIRAGNRSEMINGIDFDPFLNSQDPADRYTVREVKRKSRSWLASVYASYPQGTSAVPNVIAEVDKVGGHWQFTNFLYQRGDDLMDALRQWRKSRGGTGH